MKKHPFFSMSVMFLLGIMLYENIAFFPKIIKISFFLSIIIVSVLFLFVFHKKSQNLSRFIIIFLIVPFLMGAFKIHKDTAFREKYIKYLNNDEQVFAQGKIYKKEKKSKGYCYYLKNVYLKKNDWTHNSTYDLTFKKNITIKKDKNTKVITNNIKSSNISANKISKNIIETSIIKTNNIMVYVQNDDCFLGETILLRGNVKLFDNARNDGNFDGQQYYFSQKIDYSIINTWIEKRTLKSNQYLEQLYNTKNKISFVYLLKLNYINAGTLSNMILGEKSYLDKQVKESYQKLGLSHILAISGMHVSFFGIGLYFSLRRLGCSNKNSALISILSVVTYGYLTGMSISSIRAIGMIILMIIANLIGRTYDTINSIGLMLLVILWNNPFFYSNSGLQMSFVAVLAIATIGKNLTYNLDKQKSRLIEKAHANSKKPNQKTLFKIDLKKKILMSFSIQIATIPIILNSYYEISPYSFLINLILLPLLEYIFVSGVAGGLIGLITLSFSKIVLMPADILLNLYSLVGNLFMKFPYSTVIVGKLSIWQLVVYYIVIFLFYLMTSNYRENAKENSNFSDMRNSNKGVKNHLKDNNKKFAVYIIILFFIAFFRKPLGFEVDILDIGQGDATFVSTSSKYNLFIDGGSTDEKEIGKYKILPFLKSRGIKKIDYWFISHGDADHISGFLEVLEEGYDVGNLVLSSMMPKDEAYDKIVQLAKMKKVKIIYVEGGDKLCLKDTEIQILYPTKKADFTEEELKDRNLLSLSFILKDKEFTGLFAGDLNGEKEKELNIESNLFFYKAIHHGSKFSNTSDLLKKIKPKVTTVSCGKNNRYGHPNKEAISRIRKECVNIFYTMEGGQIKIRKNKSSFVVKQKLSVIK